MRTRFAFAFVLAATFVSALPASAADPPKVVTVPACDCTRYYVLLFGGLGKWYCPRTGHTWATFVRVTPQPGRSPIIEQFTISWLPCKLPLHPFCPIPEPGRNYGLHETMDIFDTGKQCLSLWGPYEIREKWYRQAEAHKAVLDSGAIEYVMCDHGMFGLQTKTGEPIHPERSHCVHAISRTNYALWRQSNPIIWFGEPITRWMAVCMEKVGLLVNPRVTHDWLIPALGIDRYKFTHRSIDGPVLFLPAALR